MSLNDVAASAVIGVVLAVAFVGVSIGLVFEFGHSDLKPKWRRFIGLKERDSPPGHPRVWAVAIGASLILLGEGAVFARLRDELQAGDGAIGVPLVLHFVAVVAWVTYVARGGLRPPSAD
jgi:hypothetical protein